MQYSEEYQKKVNELQRRIKSLQKSLLLMSYEKEIDRPLLYSNLKQSLFKTKEALASLQLAHLENAHKLSEST